MSIMNRCSAATRSSMRRSMSSSVSCGVSSRRSRGCGSSPSAFVRRPRSSGSSGSCRNHSYSLMLLISICPDASRYYDDNYNANHGNWSIGVGGQRSMRVHIKLRSVRAN
jgi:hypothetical protein